MRVPACALSALAACSAVLASCYRPTPQAGAPCGPSGACPTGLACRADRCVDESALPDDASAIDGVPSDSPSLPDAANVVGCADGTREAFASTNAFPAIAGCAASWTGPLSMRAPTTNQPCGNAQPCAVPADACAAGWHVCGAAGDPAELTTKVTGAECASAGNATDLAAKFVGALSHCSGFDMAGACTYTLPRDCAVNQSCAEPVCCGAGCRYDAGCPAGVFAMTGVAGSLEHGCATMIAADVTGVLCCR